MPRYSEYSAFDHRFDNQIIQKEDLRFSEQESAEEFATTEYKIDFIPRSVIKGVTGLHMIIENPEHIPHPNEVFYINSISCEG